MKKTIFLLLAACLLHLPLYAQNLVSAEYFWDDDPGVGQGSPLNLDSENLSDFSIPTTGLAPGLHFLHIRVKNDEGIWSLFVRRSVSVIKPSASAENFVAAEYFWNDDPGVGQGKALDLENESLSNFNVSAEGLAPGIHFLHVRVKNDLGIWSTYARKGVNILAEQDLGDIVAYQWSYNTPPADSSTQVIQLDTANVLEADIELPTEGLAGGNYQVYLRVQSDAGVWSETASASFVIGGCNFPDPLAIQDTSVLQQAGSGSIDFNEKLSNDSSGTLQFSVVSEPVHGSFSLQDGLLNYTASDTALGLDSLQYSVCNSCGVCDTAWWYFDVQPACTFSPPATLTDTSAVSIGQPLSLNLALLLSSEASGPLTATLLTDARQGSTSINEGIASYTAPEGSVGLDSIQYELCNSCGECASAWWYFDIQNEAPVISAGSYTIAAEGQLRIPFASLLSDINDNIDFSTFSVVSAARSGVSPVLQADQSLLLDYAGNSFSGEDSFTIQICDNVGACAEQQFIIEVEALPVVESLQVYNAVSPNGDGSNDYLHINGITAYPDNQILIINRWGDLVYQEKNYDNDKRRFEGRGNTNGAGRLPAGTYFYELNLGGQEAKISGFILLKP
ncbi:MAG: Ig-like domain-containing protein [Cyclobacteriaceae bacterium]